MQFFRLLPRYDSLDLSGSTDAANTAKNTGNTAISSYDPTAAGNTSTNAVTSNFNTAQGQNSQAVNPLQSVINSNPKVQDLYTQGNNMYNVPGQTKLVANTQNAVNNAIPAGYSAAKGFDIDSTDINNGIAAKTAYLQPQLNAEENNLTADQNLASQYVQAGQTQNAQNLIPAQENATLTAANQSAENTGWNQAQASTLQGLIDKMNAGVTLSSTEMQQAQTLAQQEEAYQQAQSTNQAGITEANIANKYKTLSPSQTLANTFTGGTYTAQ